MGRQCRLLARAAERIRRDAAPEDFHVARVATRRLRSALRVLEESDAPKAHRRALEVRRLGRRLGRVRDLDVALARVKELAPVTARDEALDAFVKHVRARRAKARLRVVRLLDSNDFARLRKKLRSLDRHLDDSAATVAKPSRSMVLAQGRLLEVDLAPTVATQEELHRYRIRVKRFRYTLELSVAKSELVARLLDGAKHLQEQLGLLNDAFVAEAMVERFTKEQPRYRESTALLALRTACHDEQAQRRAELPAVLTSFRRALAAFLVEQGGPGLRSVRPPARRTGT